MDDQIWCGKISVALSWFYSLDFKIAQNLDCVQHANSTINWLIAVLQQFNKTHLMNVYYIYAIMQCAMRFRDH